MSMSEGRAAVPSGASTGAHEAVELRDGEPVLVRLPELDFFDDKEGKPVAIHQQIGRRPLAAFGNSDGDLQMLQWTTAGPGARLGLIVHHTDGEREFAYDRDSHVGRLDRGLDILVDVDQLAPAVVETSRVPLASVMRNDPPSSTYP